MKRAVVLILTYLMVHSVGAQSLKQRLDSVKFEVIDINSNWVDHWKLLFNYDTNGILKSDNSYAWDQGNTLWIKGDTNEYTYDTNGKISQIINRLWMEDSSGFLWIPLKKWDFVYDSSGTLENKILSNWSTFYNQWIYDWNFIYTYNSLGQIVQTETKTWHFYDSIWNNMQKFVYNYDSISQDLATITGYYWQNNTIQWINSSREDYTYDSAGTLLNTVWFVWDESINQWNDAQLYEYTLDANGNKIKIIQNSNNYGLMLPERKEETTYDYSYTYNDMILPSYDLTFPFYFHVCNFNNMITGDISSYWEPVSGQWVDDGKNTYYYSEQSFILPSNPLSQNINIYPNPANDFVIFETDISSKSATLEIFDFQGKSVFKHNLNGTHRVSVSQLKKGIYLYNIITDNKKQNGKLIVQ